VVLPGQTFKVDSVTVLGTSKPYLLTEGDDRVVYSAHVKAHQVADGASSGAKTATAARPAAAPGPAAQQAREVVERAKGIEPVVTPDVQAAAKANRGRLKGLEHRFKTETSLARKLDARARTSTAGGTVEERLAKEARKVNDVLRYTVVLPFGTYKEGAAKTRQEMESKGYKTTNYWDAWSQSTTYKGQNLTFTRPPWTASRCPSRCRCTPTRRSRSSRRTTRRTRRHARPAPPPPGSRSSTAAWRPAGPRSASPRASAACPR
jgi:hypothetical protein